MRNGSRRMRTLGTSPWESDSSPSAMLQGQQGGAVGHGLFRGFFQRCRFGWCVHRRAFRASSPATNMLSKRMCLRSSWIWLGSVRPSGAESRPCFPCREIPAENRRWLRFSEGWFGSLRTTFLLHGLSESGTSAGSARCVNASFFLANDGKRYGHPRHRIDRSAAAFGGRQHCVKDGCGFLCGLQSIYVAHCWSFPSHGPQCANRFQSWWVLHATKGNTKQQRAQHARVDGDHSSSDMVLTRHEAAFMSLLLRPRVLRVALSSSVVQAQQPLVLMSFVITRQLLLWNWFDDNASTWVFGWSFFYRRRRHKHHPSVVGIFILRRLYRPSFNRRFARPIHLGARVFDAPTYTPHRLFSPPLLSRRCCLSFRSMDLNVTRSSFEDLYVFWLL